MITPSNFGTLIDPIMYIEYGLQYKSYEPLFPKIFNVMPSKNAYESLVSYAGFSLFPEKGIGASSTFQDPIQGFKGIVSQTVYSLGYIIAYEMYLYGMGRVIRWFPKALADSLTQTREVLACNILNNAFDSSYTGVDGKELCATDHPQEGGGTFANEPTSAMDLNEVALEQALIDIANITTGSGLKIPLKPKMLVIHQNNWKTAVELLGSPEAPYTANRAINPFKGLLPWMVNPHLTNPKAWFIIMEGDDGLIGFETRKPDFGRSNEFTSENIMYKGTFNIAFKWEDPRKIYGSPGVS